MSLIKVISIPVACSKASRGADNPPTVPAKAGSHGLSCAAVLRPQSLIKNWYRFFAKNFSPR